MYALKNIALKICIIYAEQSWPAQWVPLAANYSIKSLATINLSSVHELICGSFEMHAIFALAAAYI